MSAPAPKFPRPDKTTLAGLDTIARRRWDKGGHVLLLRALRSGDFSKITPERGERIYKAAAQNVAEFETFVAGCSAADRAGAQFILARWHNAAAWSAENVQSPAGDLAFRHRRSALEILQTIIADAAAKGQIPSPDVLIWRDGVRRNLDSGAGLAE